MSRVTRTHAPALGRYDRPWGPERPIFGTVRYLSSARTARKVQLRAWLAAHGA